MSSLTLFTLAVAFVWLGTVAAVARDAHARILNPAASKAAAALAFLLPFVGGALWLCIRPPETLEERRARRVVEAVLVAEAGAVGGDNSTRTALLAAVP
jgi:hypothetical protein